MIHVCLGLHDKDGRYSKFTGTTIVSIFENTSTKVIIHILHDNTLSQDNRDKFSKLAKSYRQKIYFYNVEKICASKIDKIKNLFENKSFSKFTVGTMYRLLIAEALPLEIKKTIYLDSDIIVNLDIKKLWQIELEDNVLAAVTESDGIGTPAKKYLPLCRDEIVDGDNYFNAGVLVLNLEKIRQSEELLMRGVEFIADNPQYNFFDQDILNYCFSKNFLKLSNDFNSYVVIERQNNSAPGKKIYHYLGQALKLDGRDIFNRLWFKYFAKTAWFNVDTLFNVGEGAIQMCDDLKVSALKISILTSKKRRAFFIAPSSIDAVKNMFEIEDNEEIIPVKSEDSLNSVMKSLHEAGGNKIFFVLDLRFKSIKKILEDNGFVEGKDFLNGLNFLVEVNGAVIDTYPIVKVM